MALWPGWADLAEPLGFAVVGRSRRAAQLEGSKAFMKRFLARQGIATAGFEVFTEPDAAEAYVRAASRPLVVKADGLAAAKGVVVATSTEEALDAVRAMMRERAFGDAGATVVIEELLPGEEASFHVICDGVRGVPLVAAQDHKRVFDGDLGPNTGGMGAYAPAPIVTPEVHAKIMERVVGPTLRGMAELGMPFRGVLFVGLMIEHGEPRVLEFNVRFGDPETCVLLPLYEGQVFSLLSSAAHGTLDARAPSPVGHALCVVMAAEHYPATPVTGDRIEGLEIELNKGQFLCHAGTTTRGADTVTKGGRVLSVGACSDTLEGARAAAYDAVAKISFRGEHHRGDIGHRALR